MLPLPSRARCDAHPVKRQKVEASANIHEIRHIIAMYKQTFDTQSLQKLTEDLLDIARDSEQALQQTHAEMQTTLGDQIFTKHQWACISVSQFLEPLQIIKLARVNKLMNKISYNPMVFSGKSITLYPDTHTNWNLEFSCGCQFRLLSISKRRLDVLSSMITRLMIKDCGNFNRGPFNFFGRPLMGEFPNVNVLHLRHNFTHYDPLSRLTAAEHKNLQSVASTVTKICLSFETLEDLIGVDFCFPNVETMVLFLPDDLVPPKIDFSLFPKLKNLLVDAILENVPGMSMNFPIPDTLRDLVMQVQTNVSPLTSKFTFKTGTLSLKLRSFTSFIYDSSSKHVPTMYSPPIKEVFPNAGIANCPNEGKMDFRTSLRDTPYSFAFLYLQD